MADKDCFCFCKTCEETRFVLEKIYNILNCYKWLLDSYVVDYFYEDLPSKFPSSWKNSLHKLTPNELGCWLLNEKNCVKTVLPLSLIALRQVTEIVQINRNHNGPLLYKCHNTTGENKYKTRESETNATDGSTLNVKRNNILMKHVKVKKRYEINKMGEILSDLSSKTMSSCIVDIGAGIGHLSRVLAVKHNLQVICVEQDERLLERAKKWDKELEITMKKHDSTFNLKKPYHLAVIIDSSNIYSELINKIPENLNIKNGFGIVGLHPCGDLAVNLLRLYTDCYEAKFLCIVGCCYMKMNVSDGIMQSYPLSLFVSNIPDHQLSYNALEVACHAKEKHFNKIKLGDYDDLKIHTYRAALEYVLATVDVKNRHGQLRNVKLKDNISFKEYCKSAVENTQYEDCLKSLNLESEKYQQMLNQWKEVLTFGCLRLMLAPLVETAILLDRFLYLSERNLCPTLKAEFDPEISPRNFVLTSHKD